MNLDNEPSADKVEETVSAETAASNPPESAPGNQAETPAVPSDKDDPASAEETPQKSHESSAFKRIQRQRANAERRALRAEAELDALRQQLQSRTAPPQQNGAAPKASDFASYDDYVSHLAEQKAIAAAEKAVGSVTRTLAQERSQAEAQANLRAFMSDAEKQAKAIGVDFEAAWEAITDESLTVSPHVAEYLLEAADNKAALVAHLANDPDELERLSSLSKTLAAKELAKLDLRLGAKPKPNVTKVPPIGPRVGGRAVAAPDPSRMSMEEYMEYRMGGKR